MTATAARLRPVAVLGRLQRDPAAQLQALVESRRMDGLSAERAASEVRNSRQGRQLLAEIERRRTDG